MHPQANVGFLNDQVYAHEHFWFYLFNTYLSAESVLLGVDQPIFWGVRPSAGPRCLPLRWTQGQSVHEP